MTTGRSRTRSNLWRQFWSYRGCLFPPLMVLAMLSVLYLMGTITGKLILPKPALITLPGYPDDLDVATMRLITESALWWILFVFLFWLSALVCMGYSAYLLWQALKPQNDTQERVAFGILLAAGAGVVIVTITADSSLVSMANLLKPLNLVSSGLIALAEWTNALGMVAVFAMVVSGALMLMPGSDAAEVVRKLRCSTYMLYGGAALTVLWIVQSTAMYRFAGTLVEPVQRRAIWELAPTVALVIGALISLVLAVMYLSALLWLNGRYRDFATGKSLAARSRAEARSPLTFLKTNWAEVAAVLTPMVPGVFQVVSGAFKTVA